MIYSYSKFVKSVGGARSIPAGYVSAPTLEDAIVAAEARVAEDMKYSGAARIDVVEPLSEERVVQLLNEARSW